MARRDNDYYLELMKRERPQVYADYLDGKFKNITEARRAAGQIKVRTPLEQLELAWTEASVSEREAFKMSIGCTASPGAPTAPSSSGGSGVAGTSSSPPVTHPVTPVTHPASGQASTVPTAPVSTPNHLRPGRGQLTAQERADVQEIMDRRRMKLGEVMRELGLPPLNASIGHALRHGENGSLTNDVLVRLRPWIAKHRKP